MASLIFDENSQVTAYKYIVTTTTYLYYII